MGFWKSSFLMILFKIAYIGRPLFLQKLQKNCKKNVKKGACLYMGFEKRPLFTIFFTKNRKFYKIFKKIIKFNKLIKLNKYII